MQNVMLDLETLGIRPGCVILSVGAVAFDPGTSALGPEFYCVVNRKSCEVKGLTVCPDTLAWWSRQSEESRQVLAEAERAPNGLGGALTQFTAYMQKFPKRDLCIWSLGADFDLPILSHCYSVIQQPKPWGNFAGRCYRTLRALGNVKSEYHHGVKHNSLDDAKTQAIQAMNIIRKIGDFQ